MASIVALGLIENPETKTLDTIIFDEDHLADINLCKSMKRLRRSTCNAYEDLEGLLMKVEESSKIKTLATNDKILFVHRLGKVSSGVMSGMMIKSLLVDAIQGNLVGVAINTGFLLSNLVISAGSVKMMKQGAKLTEEGKLLFGSILKLSGPFLARCPSFFFVGYDLYNHLHSNDSSSQNSVAIATDTAYITLDIAESAIEMAEIIADVEGISAITGPIGWTVGAALLIGSDLYRAVKQVEKISTVIPLTTVETVYEGIRGFIGLNPSSKVMSLIYDEQEHAKLVQEILKTMSAEPMVKRFVSPLKMSENCSIDNYMDFTTEKQSFVGLRTLPNLSDEFSYFCSTPDYSYCKGPTIKKSAEILFSKKTHAYMCTAAIGIETQYADSKLTYFRLGDGFDKIKAFEHNPNVFEIGNGKKVVTGGNEDDIFLVNGNKITGVLDGGYGYNFLNLAGVEGNFSLFINHKAIVSTETESAQSAMNITFKNIDQIQGRPNAPDFVETWCFLFKLNTLGGYDEVNSDNIIVPYSNCIYDLTIILHSNTFVSNEALYGQFKYHVENLEHGSSSLAIKNYNPIAEHVLSFDYNFYDFASVWTRVDQEFTKIIIVLNNQSNLTINVNSLKNVKLAFRDGVQCQLHGKHIIAILNTTNDLTTVEAYYASLISASTISMVIHCATTNQTTTLARGEHSEGAGTSLNIIHSNPDYKSHLKSSFHENVFSVSPYKAMWKNDTCIKFHDIDIAITEGKNLIDLTKVRRVVMTHSSDINLTISMNGTNLLFLEVSYLNENISQSCMETIGTITIRKIKAVDNISILGKGLVNIKFMRNVAYLEPSPIYFNESQNIIVLSDHDIEPNTIIFINKTLGIVGHHIYTDNSSILITNIGRESQPCSFLRTVSTNSFAVYIVNFTESRAMQSLIFQFNDIEIRAEQLKYEADKLVALTNIFDLKDCLWSSIMKLPVLVSDTLFK
uniref:Uncharacterized protein n=1 Tax=Romanomermis culicivorax TaxID=13658 RepID=A0A915I655_ROMCU